MKQADEIKGRIWKFGDDVNTDEIIPARYLSTSDPGELAQHCMEDADPQFPQKVRKGDIIVAGKNFGCGSSREHAPIAIKAAGVACVIAKSFARIFYRNAFNMGLAILESAETADLLENGEEITVSLGSGTITILKDKQTLKARPIPAFMQSLIQAGGLMNYVKQKAGL